MTRVSTITPVAAEQLKETIADRLAQARERTLSLVERLDEDQLNRQYTPILSPLIWDLGHIANFEELWLVQRIGGRSPLDGSLGALYDAIENPRAERGELPVLHGPDCFAYLAAVRERTLEVLEEIELDPAHRLLADGFVYELILAHELQHNETMLQLLALVEGYELPPTVPCPGRVDASEGMIEVPAGSFDIGAGPHGFAYDNERPSHSVQLDSFLIDAAPVTNEAFGRYLADSEAAPPMYWEPDGQGWWVSTVYGRREAVDPDRPVIHVDCGQAEAYAGWAGKRLPTEFEWEASFGLTNGCGEVWEWTSSEFAAYPGFEAFPYPEYSEVFFDEGYRVLRGGSWATHPTVARPTFRNWDLAERRQIFSGFRCAQDG